MSGAFKIQGDDKNNPYGDGLYELSVSAYEPVRGNRIGRAVVCGICISVKYGVCACAVYVSVIPAG